jgi:adenosylcobinamide-GDP ribazoletransferase
MRRALAFLTPFGGARTPAPAALAWFPVIGTLVGLGVGLVWWLSARAFSPALAGALAVAADVALTGYLHLDGLADAADGLLPPLPKERRLEVMADPATGAFALVTVATVVLLRFGAFASSAPRVLVVAALWCGSRTIMAVVARSVPYVRPGGLATAFVIATAPEVGASSVRTWATALFGAGLAVALALTGRGTHGLASLGGEVLGAGAVVLFARHRIGGYTGDVLGAAGVIGETVGLVVLAAKW